MALDHEKACRPSHNVSSSMEEARRSLYNSPPSQDMEPASQVFPDIRGVEYNPDLRLGCLGTSEAQNVPIPSQDRGPASWVAPDL